MKETHLPKRPNGYAARPLAIALSGVLALVGLAPALAAGRSSDYPAAPRLERGQSLSDAVRFLGKQAGVTVEWSLKEDYWLDNDLDLPGHGLERDVQWAIDSYKPKGALTRVVARSTGRTLKVSRSERAAMAPSPARVESRVVPPQATPTSPAAIPPVRAQLPAMGATALELAPLRVAGSVPAPAAAAATPVKSVPAAAVVAPLAAAIAPPSVVDAPPVLPQQVWRATNGSTLQTAVRDWAQRAGWTVVWDDKRPDLEIVGTVEVSGDIVKAVSYLFDVYRRSGATYAVDIYTQQKLVLVKDN